MTLADFGITFDDLRPRKTLPRAEAHLAPSRIAFDGKRSRTEYDSRSFRRANEIACDREVEMVARECRREMRRLRAAELVEGDVGLSLKTTVCIPCGAAVSHDRKLDLA